LDIVRVASVQFAFKPINSFEDFASNVERLVDQAKDSDFVVFPETFTLELQYLIPNNDFTKVYEYTEQYVELFTELSREKGQYIVAGSHPTMKDGKLYNTGYIFCPDGRCFEHSKTHLFPLEPFMGISPSDRVEILETEKARVGLAICYEIEFPEVVRILTLKGAEIVFCPSYTIGEHGFWRVRHCCQARAVENQIYVVHSCMVGTPPFPEMAGWGRSSIVTPCEEPWPPNGVLAEAETNKETVITGELDIELLHQKRESGAATTLKNRRPELYRDLT